MSSGTATTEEMIRENIKKHRHWAPASDQPVLFGSQKNRACSVIAYCIKKFPTVLSARNLQDLKKISLEV
jgi:hypothetical protein